jgi:hypothetical protein
MSPNLYLISEAEIEKIIMYIASVKVAMENIILISYFEDAYYKMRDNSQLFNSTCFKVNTFNVVI